MGILQKSSLRLTFGFTLALAIGVLLNVGLSTPSWAASSYTRVNNQTVKFSVTADVPGQSLVPTTYFVADGLVMGNDKFWAIKESSNNTAYCQLWIDMSVNGANRWTRNSIARVSGKCADKTDTYNISVNDSGASIFFSQATSGVIGPALKGSSAFEFKKVLNTTGLELTVGLNIYIQTSPTAGITCPRLLVQYASNRWGFIAPLDTGQLQTNSESSYYQQILDNYPSTRGTGRNCNANDDSGVHKSSEQALAQLIGGNTTNWGTDSGLKLKFISFKNLILSVKQMGNAVGDPSAAEIRLKTTPAGSINGPSIATGADDTTNTSKTTCAIDGIGWIVCPVMNFMGKITDSAFNFLASNFLETKSDTITNPATKNAWSVMRNLANVAFVIAFLIIIFSQMTSVGITNYGVKKMLPRLVVAAILVNLSFVICQIAVDISNILGYSLKSMFDNFQTYTQTPGAVGEDASTNGWGIATLVTGILAGSIGLALAVTVPVLFAALLALIMIVLILFGRTALIILLVVVSPLAFVAYLLPNTEQWFKKWYKMFISLLMVFPVIAVVVGASGLAAGILKAAAGDDKMLQVVAMGVATIPLFIVPSLLKNSLSAAGAIGAKLSAASSKASGRATSTAKGNLGDKYKGSAFARGRANQKQGKEEFRNRRFTNAAAGDDTSLMGRMRQRASRGVTGRTFTEAGDFAQDKAEKAARGASARAEAKDYSEAVEAATASQRNLTVGDVATIAATGTHNGQRVTEHQRAAAIDRTMSSGGFSQRRAVLEGLATDKQNTTRELRNRAVSAAYSKGDQNIFGTGFGDQILDEGGSINSAADLASATVTNAQEGHVAAEHIVQNSSATEYLVGATLASGNATAQANLVTARDRARSTATTQAKIDDVMEAQFARL